MAFRTNAFYILGITCVYKIGPSVDCLSYEFLCHLSAKLIKALKKLSGSFMKAHENTFVRVALCFLSLDYWRSGDEGTFSSWAWTKLKYQSRMSFRLPLLISLSVVVRNMPDLLIGESD